MRKALMRMAIDEMNVHGCFYAASRCILLNHEQTQTLLIKFALHTHKLGISLQLLSVPHSYNHGVDTG